MSRQPHSRIRPLLIAIALSGAFLSPAHAQITIERFAYAPGASPQAYNPNRWNYSGSLAEIPIVTNGSLTYRFRYSAGNAIVTRSYSNSTASIRMLRYSPFTTGAYYVACLLRAENIDTLYATNTCSNGVIELAASDYNAFAIAKTSDTEFIMGLCAQKFSDTNRVRVWTTNRFTTGVTYRIIVGASNIADQSDGNFALWVDPPDSDNSRAYPSTPPIISTEWDRRALSASALDEVYFGAGNGAVLIFDEIYVGHSWAEAASAHAPGAIANTLSAATNLGLRLGPAENDFPTPIIWYRFNDGATCSNGVYANAGSYGFAYNGRDGNPASNMLWVTTTKELSYTIGNRWITIPTNKAWFYTSNWSVMAWTFQYKGYRAFMSDEQNASGATNQNNFRRYNAANQDGIWFSSRENGVNYQVGVPVGSTNDYSERIHYAWTCTNGFMALYTNAILCNTGTVKLGTCTNGFLIGRWYNGTYSANGNIDDFRVYDRALTPAQLTNIVADGRK